MGYYGLYFRISKGDKMKKITKKEAINKGLKVDKLLKWIELEKKIKFMELEAKMLREDSAVNSFMSLQNEDEIIIGRQIKLKNVLSTRFNSTQFKKDNPKLYAKYQNQMVNSIMRKLI
jgi:hypothetical protein